MSFSYRFFSVWVRALLIIGFGIGRLQAGPLWDRLQGAITYEQLTQPPLPTARSSDIADLSLILDPLREFFGGNEGLQEVLRQLEDPVAARSTWVGSMELDILRMYVHALQSILLAVESEPEFKVSEKELDAARAIVNKFYLYVVRETLYMGKIPLAKDASEFHKKIRGSKEADFSTHWTTFTSAIHWINNNRNSFAKGNDLKSIDATTEFRSMQFEVAVLRTLSSTTDSGPLSTSGHHWRLLMENKIPLWMSWVIVLAAFDGHMHSNDDFVARASVVNHELARMAIEYVPPDSASIGRASLKSDLRNAHELVFNFLGRPAPELRFAPSALESDASLRKSGAGQRFKNTIIYGAARCGINLAGWLIPGDGKKK